MNHEFPSAALLKLSGIAVGMPLFAAPAEMLDNMPRALRTKLEARAQVSRSRMLDAMYRALETQQQSAPKAEPQYLPNAVVGCAVRYNYLITDYDRSIEHADGLPIVFRPGCFGNLETEDVLLVNAHDWELAGHILARTGNGTLGLESRSDGIYFATSQLEDTGYVRWTVSALRDRTLKSASVGFEMSRSHIGQFEGIQVRFCTEAELGHVALVGNAGCKGAWIKLLESI